MQPKTINGFELKQLLGAGGMAEVWYAESEIGMKAAVKILSEELSHNAQMRERFLNEAKVMVQLDHPRIRKVHGYCEIDGRPAIIMEYLEGNDLKSLLKEGTTFEDGDWVKWWNQLADALNYTHHKGVIHRDIKPANIFIDEHRNATLIDFGIAKEEGGDDLTRTGTLLGTILYMSPEQVRGKSQKEKIDYRTDLYSLAVTFVHVISGKAPYDVTTSDDLAIRNSIAEKQLDLSALPKEWQTFLAPYLEKEASKRPALVHFGQNERESDATEFEEKVADETGGDGERKDDDGKKKWGKIGIAIAAAMAVVLALWLWPKSQPKDCYDYVDLGLPSGTLWATCNLGASKPEDYGNYYAWGETETKKRYSWENYEHGNGNSRSKKLSKYCDISSEGYNGYTDSLTELQMGDDPAASNWGNGWRTPSKAQWDELLANTTQKWTKQNKVNGCLFTSKANGQTLFIPAAGCYEYRDCLAGGYYWSRSLHTVSPYYVWYLNFNSDDCNVSNYIRFYGFSVRPVREKPEIFQIMTDYSEEEQKEDAAFKDCSTIAACEDYLKTYPEGRYVEEVRAKKAELEAKAAQTSLTGIANGHEWVDLDLPSGTLWATCNVGASSPEDYGNYYAWGETSTKSTYDWESYRYAQGTTLVDPRLTKYCSKSFDGNNGFTDNLTTLQASDDAATANWGSGWRTPSKAQWVELKNNTTNTRTTRNEVKGSLFTSKKNGQSVFLPTAGGRWYSDLDSYGDYWSRSLSEDIVRARYLRVYSEDCYMGYCVRCEGFSVRPVRDSSK